MILALQRDPLTRQNLRALARLDHALAVLRSGRPLTTRNARLAGFVVLQARRDLEAGGCLDLWHERVAAVLP